MGKDKKRNKSGKARGLRIESYDLEDAILPDEVLEIQSEEIRLEETQSEEIQSEEIQSEEIQSSKIQNEEIQNEKIQDEEIQNEEIQDEEIQDEEIQDEEIQNEVIQSEKNQIGEIPAEEKLKDSDPVLDEGLILEELIEKRAGLENESKKTDFSAKATKKKISKKTIAIAAGSVAVVLFVIYVGVAMYFSERFLPGTIINGEVCSGKNAEEIEASLQEKVEGYVLTIEERNDMSEEIKGTEIDVQYHNTGQIQKLMEAQNKFTWPVALFKQNEIDTKVDFVYDEAKLQEKIAALECLKEENQIAPTNAVPVEKDGTYVIQEETYGSKIKSEELANAIVASVNAMEQTLNLEEADCYVAPVYFKDSEEVIAAKDALNKCLETKITYSLDSIEVVLDKTQISQWISVDENMNLLISESGVSAFAKSLGDTYNTKPKSQKITTPTGKVATIAGAAKGRIIGTAAESEQLQGEIKAGTVTTREPIIAQHETAPDQYVWGSTYVEVDLSAQHMWYIKNNNVVFESDVVTGSPGRDTPAGVFQILTKKRNKTLVGNIMPETGKPEYETPVDYWARVTWSGIGFHDATWQPAFGGQLYKQGYGSHGCINMPLGAVAEFYGMISVGDPVVIHY